MRLPTRLPVEHITLRSIPEASGSLSLFGTAINSLWRVDHTQPTGYDEPEIDLGGEADPAKCEAESATSGTHKSVALDAP